MTEKLDYSALGYRRKPSWIYGVACCFLLTPLGNFLISLIVLKVPQWHRPQVWIRWLPYVPFKTWILMGLVWTSGLLLLLFVRRWALLWTLGTLALVAVFNLVTIKEFSFLGPITILAMAGVSVFMGYLLYFTRFRLPYTNPKIRWWETSPRYKVNIPIHIDGVTTHGTLLDISLTGALVEWTSEDLVPSAELLHSIILPPDLRLRCGPARRTSRGYGLQFLVEDRQTRQRFKNWIHQLGTDPSQIYW